MPLDIRVRLPFRLYGSNEGVTSFVSALSASYHIFMYGGEICFIGTAFSQPRSPKVAKNQVMLLMLGIAENQSTQV
jgi:hypothetical protein